MTREGIGTRASTARNVKQAEPAPNLEHPWSDLGACSDRVRRRAHWTLFAGLRGRRSTFAVRHHFRKVIFCGKHSICARSGTDFVAGEVRRRCRGRRTTLPRSSTVAGAALSQGLLSQGQLLFRGRRRTFAKSGASEVRCRFRCRRITFTRSGADFVAGAALSGQIQISWQAQQGTDFAVQVAWEAQHLIDR